MRTRPGSAAAQAARSCCRRYRRSGACTSQRCTKRITSRMALSRTSRSWIDEAPLPVVKRIVAKLPPPPTRLLVPYIDTVHNRVPIEIMRGCTRGCRFCQAGMITRPVRERPVEEVVDAIEEALANTGYEEVGLLSLSSSDYTHILELVNSGQRALCRAQPVHLAALPADRILLGRADGRLERLAPQRFHPGARSRHRAHARDHQQAGQHRAAAGDRPGDLLARLAQHQAVLHDRPPLRDDRGRAGDRRPVQSGAGRRAQDHRAPGPGHRRGEHLRPQAAHPLPVGALRHDRADRRQTRPAEAQACAVPG